MKIVVLGKNGLLGSEIATILEHVQGVQCVAFGHEDFDITDSKTLFEVVEEVKPGFVINATGYTNVDKAEEEKELVMKVNGFAVGELAKICGEKKIPLMHFSTDYVFDGNHDPLGYDENAKPNPMNAYGESKKLGEELLTQHTPYYFLIRSQWLFGKSGKNFVSAILEQARTKRSLRVVNDQFGKPTFANDLAEALIPFFEERRSERFASGRGYGIYHVVNEGVTSWFDYAKEILALAGIQKEVIPIPSEELNRPAKRPKYSALINTKLPKLRTWQKALKEYLHQLLTTHERYHSRRRTRDTTLPVVKSHE